jgi:hypothetical protein
MLESKHRLHKRYMKLGAAGKDQRKLVTAVARELLGFVWAIGTRAETVASQQLKVANPSLSAIKPLFSVI